MKKEKIFSRVLIAVVSVLMCVTIVNAFVFAKISESDKGSITINNLEEETQTLKISAYRLTDVNYDYENNEPTDPMYSWVTNIANFFTENAKYEQYSDPEVFADTEGDRPAVEFYDLLAKYIRSETDIVLVQQSVDPKTTSTTIDNLVPGTYLVLIENGFNVYRASVVNVVPVYDEASKDWVMSNPELEIKSSLPSIEKKVNNADTDIVSTADTIEFSLVAEIPNYDTNSISHNFWISDKFSNGLTLNAESIKVFGVNELGEETPLTVEEAYKVKTTGATRPTETKEEVTFSLEFDYDKIKSYEKIHVTYEAKLNKDATVVMDGDGNKNTAYVDYSNNPYDPEDPYISKEDETTVYTYQATITKLDSKTNEVLSGAEFELYKDAEAEEEPMKFTAGDDGYYVADDTEENVKLVVDEDGKLYIKGLDNGTYYLKETKAPAGYVRLNAPVTITVENENVVLDVKNKAGFELPITGGIGTVIFTAVGSIIFGAGVLVLILMVYKRKQQKVN